MGFSLSVSSGESAIRISIIMYIDTYVAVLVSCVRIYVHTYIHTYHRYMVIDFHIPLILIGDVRHMTTAVVHLMQ